LHLLLGHHFYGAGNLGDDFMLGGFLEALQTQAPGTTCTCRVPFPLQPLRDRFPAIEWLPCDPALLEPCLRRADAWLGLGGSPFQQAQSAWFLDHLTAEAAACERLGKPMFYLGVGVQGEAEAREPAVRRLIAQAAGIWTRDPASAERLAALAPRRPVVAASDLAHLWFRAQPPRTAVPGRLNLTPNFDFGPWPGRDELLAAVEALGVEDRVWLVQETRDLPGAERALYAGLRPAERARCWACLLLLS
jgi:polysaccharide pyruvyl transferase WcaK-like protein